MCSSIYRLWKEDKTGKAIKYRSVGTGNPHHPVPTPGPGDNHPFFLNPAMPVERLFVPQCL